MLAAPRRNLSRRAPVKRPLPSLWLLLHVLVEERNRVLHSADLHGIGIIDALAVSPDVNETVHIVLVGRPLGLLAELDQELVADPKDSLQLIAVAALHEYRGADGSHPRLRNLLGDARANFPGLPHQHALDIEEAGR